MVNKNKSLKAITPAIKLGVASIGINIVGAKLQPSLPAGTINPLTQIGTSGSRFSPLLGTLGLTGLSLKELKKLKGGKK